MTKYNEVANLNGDSIDDSDTGLIFKSSRVEDLNSLEEHKICNRAVMTDDELISHIFS